MRHANGRQEREGEAFWRFSLALYVRPGVAEALIALQDRAGRDVNLVLFCLWLGARRARLLDAAGLAAAEAAIAPLAAGAVRPLRQLRRRLKGAPERDLQALRRRVVGLELAAERQVQERLAALPLAAAPAADGLAAAAANLALYLGAESGAPAAVLRRALRALARRD
jgi:uncharacterized protein (TIGR02444 family)